MLIVQSLFIFQEPVKQQDRYTAEWNVPGAIQADQTVSGTSWLTFWPDCKAIPAYGLMMSVCLSVCPSVCQHFF